MAPAGQRSYAPRVASVAHTWHPRAKGHMYHAWHLSPTRGTRGPKVICTTRGICRPRMAPAGQRSYAPRVASVAHAWHPRAKGHMYHAWHLSPMRGTRGPKVICTTRGICRPCVAPAGQRSYVPRVASVAHRCICHVWTTCQVYGQKHKIGTTLGELNWLDAILQKHSTASLRMDIGTYVYGASGGMTLVRGKSRGTFCNPLCALVAILVPHVATRRSLRPPSPGVSTTRG